MFFPVFLSVVFVVRNHSANIEKLLSDAATGISSFVSDYELIIVDNASDDESVAVLKKLTGENGLPNLQVYALTKEVDADTASWVGLENALGDFVAVIDPWRTTSGSCRKCWRRQSAAPMSSSPPMRKKLAQSLAYRGAYVVFDGLQMVQRH